MLSLAGWRFIAPSTHAASAGRFLPLSKRAGRLQLVPATAIPGEYIPSICHFWQLTDRQILTHNAESARGLRAHNSNIRER